MPIIEPNNISLGLGNLEFGEYVNGVFTSYTDIGAIKGELTLTHEREILDFDSGRPLVTIKQEVIRDKVMIKATLAEINLATIRLALGSGTVFSSSVPVFLDGTSTALSGTLATGKTSVTSGQLMKFGGSPRHAFIGLRFTHRKQNNKRIIIEAYKASPMGNLVLPFREEDYNLYDVEFRLLAEYCKPQGEQYYQVIVENDVPTPSCL